MKKTIFSIILVVVIYLIIGGFGITALEIPDEAIRLRVVPNSNATYDQEIKTKVKDSLQSNLYDLLKDTKGIDDARVIIEDHLEEIDHKVANLLKQENYTMGYDIKFGYNHFPAKEFKGTTYQEGMYESVLVTLGSGEGDNWWCVLFPPLCLMEAEESDTIEYTSFVKELIDRYL